MPFLCCRLIIILLSISVLTLTLAKVCPHFHFITLDSFYRWQFLLVNPAHKFPRFTTLVSNFLDLDVKKWSFGGFDYSFEWLPILKISWHSVFIEWSIIVFIPPLLGMFYNIICKSTCPEITFPWWNHLQIIQAHLPQQLPFSQHIL